MRLKDKKDTKEYTARFENWSEFIEFCDKAPSYGLGNNSRGGGKSFTGTHSFEEALLLAEQGWEEGTKKVETTSLKEFNAVSESIERPYYVYDYEGSDIDIARFIDGEPEVWLRREEVITQGPGRRIFHIVFNCTVSAQVDNQTIINRGAAACALIQALEFSGNGVDLTLVMSCSSQSEYFSKGIANQRAEIYVPLKSSDQPLDMPRVAFALAHPSVLRRFMFSAEERLPYGKEFKVGSGYGYPPFESREMGDIYFGSASALDMNWNNQEEVTRWIKLMLEKQGIVLRKEE